MEQLRINIHEVVKSLFNSDVDIELTRPDEQFGDFSTNVALQLAKPIGKNPREIAEQLITEIRQKLPEQIVDVSVAGPGFINIKLTDKALLGLLDQEVCQVYAGKQVVAEYSDPNPFKVLHAGHLYTTITGDAIASLLHAAGGTVHRLNYGGDVGLHVGRTMWAIIEYLGGENPEKLANVEPSERLEWMSARYVEGNNAYEDNKKAKDQIIDTNKRVYDLHSDNDHDSDFAKIYWTCREWSYKGFDKLYEQLQVNPFEKYIPESEVTPLGLKIVNEGLENGVFVKSEGAVVFVGEEHGLHTRVFVNSNGLPTYEAKDLGLAAYKWEQYHFDLGVIITANDIVEYMKVVVKALSNFYPEIAERTKHLTHGVIKLPGGVKMSSRKGNILRATDIIEAAEKASKAAMETNSHETTLAAVKYAFLKVRTGGDIIYDPEESVSLLGNSGPYLQYAHARARSILAKVEQSDTRLESLETDERSMVRKIGEYVEVVDKAVEELSPHLVCTYLYELAQVFNRFYEKNHVVGDPREAVRAKLVGLYADRLKEGLGLLGIVAPDRM